MDVFDYISYANPEEALQLLSANGYELAQFQNEQDLAQGLKHLVSEVGQPAMVAVARMHPDRDLIADYFTIEPANGSTQSAGNTMASQANASKTTGCGCSGGKRKSSSDYGKYAAYMLNGLLIGGFILLGLALIINQK